MDTACSTASGRDEIATRNSEAALQSDLIHVKQPHCLVAMHLEQHVHGVSVRVQPSARARRAHPEQRLEAVRARQEAHAIYATGHNETSAPPPSSTCVGADLSVASCAASCACALASRARRGIDSRLLIGKAAVHLSQRKVLTQHREHGVALCATDLSPRWRASAPYRGAAARTTTVAGLGAQSCPAPPRHTVQ